MRGETTRPNWLAIHEVPERHEAGRAGDGGVCDFGVGLDPEHNTSPWG